MNEIQKKILINVVGSAAALAIKGSSKLIASGVKKHKEKKLMKDLDREARTLMTCEYLDIYPIVYMGDLTK